MQWARQAFREGLLDADFATQSLDESMRKFCDGEAGIAMLDASIGGAYKLQQMWQQRQPEKEITEYLAVLPQPITPSGISYNAAERCTSGTFFSARMDDTRMQRAYELFDWLLGEPGLQLARFGRSHTTQDGRIQSTLTDEQGQPIPFIDAGKAWSRMGVLATYAQDYAPELDPQGFAATEQTQLIQTYWPNNWRQGMFTLCALNGRPPTAQDAPVRQAISDLLTQPGDADTLWEAYVATIDTLCDRAALEQAAAQAAQSLGITTEE